MISTREVFDRMKRYRRERNELRQQMAKIKDLPEKILALQKQVENLEQQLKDSSATINIEQLKSELLRELENKMQKILSNSTNLSQSDSLEEENTESSTSLEKEINNLISHKENNLSVEEILAEEPIEELELDDSEIESSDLWLESLAK
jgi:hypothetical protein